MESKPQDKLIKFSYKMKILFNEIFLGTVIFTDKYE